VAESVQPTAMTDKVAGLGATLQGLERRAGLRSHLLLSLFAFSPGQ